MQLLARLHHADLRLLGTIFRQGNRRAIRRLARALSRTGDGFLHVAAAALVVVLRAPQAWHFVTLLALSLCVERSVYFLLKNSLRRPRPADAVPGFHSLITAADKFSFPSGHTSAAFLLASCFCTVFGVLAMPLFAWATLVALSRVVLGVHYPGDTAAGAAIGCTVASATAAFL